MRLIELEPEFVLTLTPSIDSGCWHGFITNGEVA